MVKTIALTGNGSQFLSQLLGSRAVGAMPVISEIKAYTPSAGDLLRARSVEEIIKQYELASAACVSVVTGKWFGGSLEFLERVARVTSLPILHKDFIASRSAIERSKKLGASAVLLTKKLVNGPTLNKLAQYSITLGLTPFVEVDSLQDMQGVQLSNEAMLAINNRNICVKETDNGDIATSLSLLAAARASGAGAVVSASAIQTVEQGRQLLEAGFDGLLIGTAFLQAPDLTEILAVFRNGLSKVSDEHANLS